MSSNQRGYTLVEALVATGLAALVVVAVTQSLRASVDAQRRIAETDHFIEDAANVMAMAKARMPVGSIQATYPELVLSLEPVPLTAPAPDGHWRPMKLSVRHSTNQNLYVETIVMAQGAK